LFTRDPDCAADGMSTAAQEMKGGLSWELAVAKAESATAVAATTKADAAIKTMAANAPTDPQTLQGFRGPCANLAQPHCTTSRLVPPGLFTHGFSNHPET
jgi:hypothetical protein